jgi:hypothetical protein
MERASTFSQLSEILTALDAAHVRLLDYCSQLDSLFDDEQHNLFPPRLQEDQSRIHRSLQTFLNDPKYENALRTWIQYVPGRELEVRIATVTELDAPKFETFAARIIDFYKEAGGFVQRIREQTASEDAQRLLDDLALQEEQAAKSFSSRLLGLNDT